MNPVGLWRRATATEFDSTDEEDIESEDELAMDLSLSEDDDDDEDDVSQYPMGQNGPVRNAQWTSAAAAAGHALRSRERTACT